VQDSMRAIATLLSRKPELIFLDLVMPNTNGYEICSQLRKVSAFRDTPIVILTGNDGIIDRVRAKVVGASDFLSKPVDAATVLEVTNRYLQQAQATE
jgi:two-component system, chemotaxis family, response regulator PixG